MLPPAYGPVSARLSGKTLRTRSDGRQEVALACFELLVAPDEIARHTRGRHMHPQRDDVGHRPCKASLCLCVIKAVFVCGAHRLGEAQRHLRDRLEHGTEAACGELVTEIPTKHRGRHLHAHVTHDRRQGRKRERNAPP